MSKRQYHIFYLMMQADGIYEKSVEIHEVKRHLPIPSGSVSLYYALWPEYRRNQGMQDAEQLMELLIPYLPRLKQVVWTGEEGTVSESLQNYLYEEYGMILLFDRRIPDGAVVIRRAQAWKFLDATVKNGYNTLVHYGNIRRI